MARGEGQKSKILYILKILWEYSDEKHPLTATQICSYLLEYGISCERKTIYTDLEELEAFGLDIIRSKQGAYIGRRPFELPELKLLVDAVQSSRFITEKKTAVMTAKLGGLLSCYDSRALRRQLSLKSRVKPQNESIYYNVDAISEAIQEDLQITFLYWNWTVQKEMQIKRNGERYRISPWVLMWENEKYYMVGYDAEANRLKHFRVDKMLRIEVIQVQRQGKELYEQLDINSYGIENFSMFQGRRETVTLVAELDMSGVLIDRFGRDVWMYQQDEKHCVVVTDVVVSQPFFGWIVGLGGKVRIQQPLWVVEEFEMLLKRMICAKDI